ncbi:MAG: helix-turn-helix transcriptional regulator [Desulfamplus sp.]|nr:helix-turn-helix transcriptional regulator [Desulfamplus sp.]MBF0412131.1 helix-turn-helix transcriptional regulator [Desulfamplus sp.]
MANQPPNNTCLSKCATNEYAQQIKELLPPDTQLLELANFFKVFGENSRIKILSAIYHRELCVCDLVEILGMTQSAISQQLRVLRASKVVKYRKEGKNVYYSLDDKHVYKMLEDGLEHIKEHLN